MVDIPSSVHLKSKVYQSVNAMIICIKPKKSNLLGFSADIPMIEVVPAVLLILAFPLTNRACLMLDHNAFLELSIEVSTSVSTVHGD